MRAGFVEEKADREQKRHFDDAKNEQKHSLQTHVQSLRIS